MSVFYIDLDGTLLNIHKRYYKLYLNAVHMSQGNSLSQSKYWSLKRNNICEREIAILSEIGDVDGYIDYRNSNIEEPMYLEYDSVISGVYSILGQLKTDNTLILTTLRHDISKALAQLKLFNLIEYFSKVLINGNNVDAHNAYYTKRDLIQSDGDYRQKNSFVIGDTEVDIISGKLLGIKTISVTSGIRGRSYLNSYSPDYIIPSIARINSSLKCL